MQQKDKRAAVYEEEEEGAILDTPTKQSATEDP
jgi:hypothetical protein